MLQRIMNVVLCFMSICISNLLHLQLRVVANNTNYVPLENIVLNCGSNTSELVQYDGRNWIGDIASSYVSSNADIKSFIIARAPSTLQSIPEVPYMTARIFRSKFTYKFNVTPGPKFIRLHFYPASYLNLNVSRAFLSVTAGEFTLLRNFSVSLNADYLNFAYLMKEFIVHVSRNTTLELSFSPTKSNAYDDDAYAFVNGIEVVSMPVGVYIRGNSAPIPLVGHDQQLVYIYNDTAMENLYRLNVGGEQILPRYDTGMFRTWDTDNGYVFGANSIRPFNMSMEVVYTDKVPAYTAPADVYRTSRSMATFEKGLVNLNYNQTWFFPVDSGFLYLVRLHFCEIFDEITRNNEVVFSVFLNNQTAEQQFDPIAISGEPRVAIYQDYAVMVPKGSNEAKQDLWLDLHPFKYSKPYYYTAYLNGLEIFKLSSVDEKNFAGLNPSEKTIGSSVKARRVKHSKKLMFILIGCGLFALVLPILLCLVLCRLKVIRPKRIIKSWCDLRGVLSPSQNEKAKKESSIRSPFSLTEIKKATNDFDETLLIGKGGFGGVYKGSFDDGKTFVAIKRGNPMSEQDIAEFETEIHLLSQLRHNNLVSLLGHCSEDGEMILVYDFMANGTLYDHLHLKQRDQYEHQNQPHLSWVRRLEICIGVVRGLHYLHTGTKNRIIHRDIKTTNILLDQNWLARISDFGVSKASNPSLSTTTVKGSIGYLDPEYYQCHKLTEKSDIYSLGVVLLEVLSTRPAISQCEDDDDNDNDENLNLAEWAMFCYENGNVEKIVDPKLEGDIVKECFELYLGVTIKCLAERGVDRPSTSDVLQKLDLALQLQKNAGTNILEGNIQHIHKNDNTDLQGFSDLTPGIEFSEITVPIGR